MEDAAISGNWLQEVLGLMGYNTSVDVRTLEASPETSSNNYWLEIKADNLQEQQIQRLIGEDGHSLDALQYLANTHLNRHFSQDASQQHTHNFYTIELNGYRSERLEYLNSLAQNAAQQVRETKNEFVIKHLSAADRRYIHQLLESFPDIETHSQGRDPHRHLIVNFKS